MRGVLKHYKPGELEEDTVARRRRVQDADHPHTLTSASNLAIDMRCANSARPSMSPPESSADRPSAD
jgi:hypothetical protein